MPGAGQYYLPQSGQNYLPFPAAILRTVQRVLGRSGRVASVITRSITSGGISAGRPLRGRSANPSIPSRSNRCDHLFTQATLTPNSPATSTCLAPAALLNTIAARRLSRCAVVCALTLRSSSVRSSSVISTTDTGRAMPQYGTNQLFFQPNCRTGH